MLDRNEATRQQMLLEVLGRLVRLPKLSSQSESKRPIPNISLLLTGQHLISEILFVLVLPFRLGPLRLHPLVMSVAQLYLAAGLHEEARAPPPHPLCILTAHRSQ